MQILKQCVTALAVATLVFTLDVSVGSIVPEGHSPYYGAAHAARKSGRKSTFGRKKTSTKKIRTSSSSSASKSKPAPKKPVAKVAKAPPKPAVVAKPPQGTFAQAADRSRSQQALAARNDQAKKARTSNTVAQKATSNGKTYRRTEVRQARSTFYSSSDSRFSQQNHTRAERYGDRYEGRDSGGFDPTFLALMMMSDDPGSTALMYGLTGSPMLAVMMSDFRQEAESSGDTEMLARLNAQEAEIARLKASGATPQPVEETLASMGIPAEVALSEDVLTGQVLPPFTLWSGSEGGNYLAYCQSLQKTLDGVIDVRCQTSSGSLENIEAFCTNLADAKLAQSDTRGQNVSRCNYGEYDLDVYPEFVYMITNRGLKADSIKDLPKGTILYVGPQGSGTGQAWKGVIDQDPDRYGAEYFTPMHADYMDAAAAVAANPNAAMLYVSALGSTLMQSIDEKHGDKLRLVAVDDWDFNDAEDAQGNPIYDFYEVPAGTYPKMQRGVGSLETLTVTAVLTINPSWVNTYGEEAAQNILTATQWINQE